MEKFRKLVEAGPIGLQPWAEEKLGEYADTIVRYDHIPQDEDELVDMVGDADALLVRTQPAVPASVLSRRRAPTSTSTTPRSTASPCTASGTMETRV